MSPTFTKHSIRVFDEMMVDDRWNGLSGYLGARLRLIEDGLDERGESLSRRKKWLRKADLVAVTYANIHRWSWARLFAWAQSVRGRDFMEFCRDDRRDPADIGRDAARRDYFHVYGYDDSRPS